MINKDFHVHLHGCVTAEQLWNIGKDCYKNRIFMLDWYSSEYEKAWGRKPEYLKYWQSENGLELLKKDYHFTKMNSFDRFQANFNLIIALCNISPDNFTVQEQIILNVNNQSLEYFEARTLIPFRFDAQQTYEYLKGLCTLVKQSNSDLKMSTKLVFSLFRDNNLAKLHYDWIRLFIDKHPDLANEIVGIDFAYKEEGAPPKNKTDLFKLFHDDNKSKRKLHIFYHVGESFEDKSIVSAIRWVMEAQELGADRLGHATALGVDPRNYLDKIVTESSEERIDTLNWLLKNSDILALNGYEFDLSDVKKVLADLIVNNNDISVVYNDEYIRDVRLLQSAVMKILKYRNVIIESCPTSNQRIGQIKTMKYHPLIRFKKENLNILLGTDDPGIFNINWLDESMFIDKLLSYYY